MTWEIDNIKDFGQSDCNHNCQPILEIDIKIEIVENEGRGQTKQAHIFILNKDKQPLTNLKSNNFHSLTAKWGQIDQYCWRLQCFLCLINLGLTVQNRQGQQKSLHYFASQKRLSKIHN
jgi:hypothetical protein